MGREVRRVPKDWVHPLENGLDSQGQPLQHHKPLYDADFYQDCANEWIAAFQKGGLQHALDTEGDPPNRCDYMPEWTEEEATHFMMYETTSEGTPISPACETPEALARWLTDNKASANGDMTATYEQWLRVCRDGYACSMVMKGGVLMSGVEGLSDE